ncbi:respiratory nitrate reductase subunit gamma [Arhodomonas sp. AD133]|uniref:respiratory nitrate reductase subunit gamma n=1 Tax=Arhodomonas sp. AD133 TaxID=3415009 RepID=UPI003EBBC280
MSFLNNLFFGYYPYIAGTVFLVGSVVRFDMSQYTWKTNSSQLFDSSRRFRLGNALFHIGVIFLFFGHLIGLLMPHSWYPIFGLTATSKQLLAMISGGLFGVLALIGGAILIHRRLTNERVRANSGQMDLFILLLLYVQLILGMLTIPISATHLDGSMMLLLADWAQHIVTFRPEAAAYVAEASWVFKLHLFLGITIFLLFPFTRLVHIWSAPVWYLGRSYQLVRQRQA